VIQYLKSPSPLKQPSTAVEQVEKKTNIFLKTLWKTASPIPQETSPAVLTDCVTTPEKTFIGVMISHMGPIYYQIRKYHSITLLK